MALFGLITALAYLVAPAQAAYDPGLSAGGQEHTMEGRGWTHLSAGRFSQALYSFAHQASRNPTEGAAKVGYALSAAALGGLSRSVGAMRCALRIDPESMHSLSIDEQLQPGIERLIECYEAFGCEIGHNHDMAFMIASLYYLLHDLESARTAIELAEEEGDRKPSTANLRSLIEQELADEARPDGDDRARLGAHHQPRAQEVEAATAVMEEHEPQLQEVLDALDEIIDAALKLQESLLQALPTLEPT